MLDTDFPYNRFEHKRSNQAAWVITFADMMALLLTFFIVMHSFSSLNLQKYKAVSEAMQGVFGVQQQMAQEDNKTEIKRDGKTDIEITESESELFSQLKELLKSEQQHGLVQIHKNGNQIVLRFPERVAFASGSDVLRDEFSPIVKKVVDILQASTGLILVSGHTDDKPIHTERFRSNWELSAARAVSVIHSLLKNSELSSERVIAQGYGDTRPIMPNDNDLNRMMNRRVDITIMEDVAQDEQPADDGKDVIRLH
ncbi:MAG: OmpA family protein [Gammaproteobacteria bacterium]|nr:OmpA family protein [Gammaproteobacteria bacterium]MDH5731516.1 OmpA family protein [Gammaproteobacteria bacterium]